MLHWVSPSPRSGRPPPPSSLHLKKMLQAGPCSYIRYPAVTLAFCRHYLDLALSRWILDLALSRWILDLALSRWILDLALSRWIHRCQVHPSVHAVWPVGSCWYIAARYIHQYMRYGPSDHAGTSRSTGPRDGICSTTW
jgi:hypothetical protein